MSLIDRKEIMAVAKKSRIPWGFTVDLLMKAFKIDKLNKIYDDASHEKGVEFIASVLKGLQITVEIDEQSLKNIPKEGSFIAIANHPYGLLDGLIFIKTLVEARADGKVMGNFLLQRIDPLKEFILPVNPFEGAKGSGVSIAGLKATMQYLADGHPVGMFPAGEVATFQDSFKNITDRAWQPSAIRIIEKAKVPVVPMFFEGSNSMSFHLLGKIHPLLRTVKIPSELVNKQRRKVRLRVGSPIQPSEWADFENVNKMGRFLRARVEALGSSLKEVKKFYRPSFRLPQKPQEIIPETPKELLLPEVALLREQKQVLHRKKQFEVLVGSAQQMPNLLNEIGRLREITFRAIGEGTNRKIDVDEYDLYYKHLFVWDTEEERVVGAYRLGEGRNIMPQYGHKGFYITSLFHLNNDGFNSILEQAVELGRSFVVPEYQQKPLPLFLLWQGILAFLIKNPNYQYLIGPVSISNTYSNLSKSFLIAFIKAHYYDHDLAKLVTARTEFKVEFDNTDAEILMEQFRGDVAQLDKLIAEIEPARYRVPVLLKKYMKQNAKIIGFNIDPKFNDALDGLMLLNLDDLPEGTISKLRKELNMD